MVDIAGNEVKVGDKVFVICRYGRRRLYRGVIKKINHKTIGIEGSCRCITAGAFILDTTDEVERLRERDIFLGYLEDFGVDNWSGYDEACREYQDR